MKKRVIYKGTKVTLTVTDLRLPGGRAVQRELVEHPGAVVVVPLFDDGMVLLEDHYRFAVGGNLLELPAGTLEPGEDPSRCAYRELAEETGLAAAEMIHLATFYTSPGILTEKMHAYLARGLVRGERNLEDDEIIEAVEIPFDKLLDMAASGQIRDSKTIATLFLTDAFLRREQGRRE